MIGIQKELAQAKHEKEIASTKVDLHKIQAQVDQIYFGILLSRQQQKTIVLLANNLQEQRTTVRSKVKNGVLLPSQQHIREAALIKLRQDAAETHIVAGYKVLSLKNTKDTYLLKDHAKNE